MPDYRISRPARADLREIRAYLLREAGRNVADYVEDKLLEAFDELVRLRAVGHKRSDVNRPDLLFHTVFRYVIVFRREPKVAIVRVLHGSRDLPKLLH